MTMPRRRAPKLDERDEASVPKVERGKTGTTGLPSNRDSRQRSDREIEHLVVRSAFRVILVGVGTFVLLVLLWRLRLLVVLVLVAGFIAALLHPAVTVLERRNVKRGIAVAVVCMCVLVIAFGLGYVLVHPAYGSAVKFARELPKLVVQAEHGKGQIGRLIKRLHLASYVTRNAPHLEAAIGHLGKPALAVGKTVLNGLVSVFTVSVLTVFLLLNGPKMFRGILGLLSQESAGLARRVANDMVRQVSGYMLGNLSTSVIAGIVVYITLRVTNVPFASVLAIWVALVDFLPLIGGLLAGIPTVALAFLHSVPAGVVTLIVFLVYTQVENHLLMPVIVSRTVKLNTLLVLFAVLIGVEVGDVVGSTFGGLAGAILAVPAAGGLQVAFRAVLEQRRGKVKKDLS